MPSPQDNRRWAAPSGSWPGPAAYESSASYRVRTDAEENTSRVGLPSWSTGSPANHDGVVGDAAIVGAWWVPGRMFRRRR